MAAGLSTRRAVCALLLAAALLAAAGAPSRAAGADGASGLDRLFGSSSIRNDRLELFPKWRGALARARVERRDPAGCGDSGLGSCERADWQAFLDGLRDRGAVEQLEAVNRQMNEHRYILDPRNWGVEDYWATPLQFLARDGDCEDYAIAKFMSLRALGWASAALRIVVVDDLNLGVQHAVLAVAHQGGVYVLDNQSPSVMRAERIRHYRPIYSVNEESWWLHRS